MINPWIVLGVGAVILAVGIGAERAGYQRGVNAEKVASQGKLDKLNDDLAKQEALANHELEVANAENMRIVSEREKLKHQLGANREKAVVAANELRNVLAVERLRFGTTEPAISGTSCDSAKAGSGSSPSVASPTIVQLPDAVTRDLRSFAYDAEKLRIDYQLCYDYAQQVR